MTDNEGEKITAIKTLLSRNSKDQSISDELKVLLSDAGVNQINEDIAQTWDLQASLAQKLSHLSMTATNEQRGVMNNILTLSDTLKKTAAKAIAQIEDERKKLIVIYEVFRKKGSEKAFNKSFKDKSFKLALEELLDEKSGIVQAKRKPQKILEEKEDDDEGDNTKFFSMVEFKEEIENVRHSFINAQPPAQTQQEELQEVIQETKFKKAGGPEMAGSGVVAVPVLPQPSVAVESKMTEAHPFIQKLVKTNEVFIAYPVKDSRPTRDQLPILRDPNVKINIWGILKDNIGKDLSKITMPVYLNEPLSLLQKQAEIMEYSELFRKANSLDDPYLRLINIFAGLFMVYTNTPNRMKKPFNPLLGETFEYQDGDLRVLYEQVSHHPPVCATYGECKDFTFKADFYLKSKLSISGFEFLNLGSLEITLKKTGETFSTVKKPSASVHNYIIGKPYLWFNGDHQLVNKKTGDEISVNFKAKGWTSKNDYEVEGFVKDSAGNVKYHVFGKWDSFLSVINAATKQETKIASKHEPVKDYELQYLFPKHSINLNHLSTEMVKQLCPTDARFRTDQRAYENGNLELAASEKNRLEESQRRRRKENEAAGRHWEPVWFDFQINGDEFTSKYKGGYWEAKEKNSWPAKLLDLYNE